MSWSQFHVYYFHEKVSNQMTKEIDFLLQQERRGATVVWS
jgi:hypothetical protein